MSLQSEHGLNPNPGDVCKGLHEMDWASTLTVAQCQHRPCYRDR